MDRILKSKCRYCGGDLEMYTVHGDRNNNGIVGYTTKIHCLTCKSNMFEFSSTSDGIPNAEKILFERYGIIKEG